MQAKTLLEKYSFEKYLLEVAITTLEKGMSASKLSTYHFLPPTDAWGFPKYPGKTAILPSGSDLLEELRAFIALNRSFLLEADSWLGTWIHPISHCYYLDVTTSRVELEEARREAIARSQQEGRNIVALYNSKREQTVYLWGGSPEEEAIRKDLLHDTSPYVLPDVNPETIANLLKPRAHMPYSGIDLMPETTSF